MKHNWLTVSVGKSQTQDIPVIGLHFFKARIIDRAQLEPERYAFNKTIGYRVTERLSRTRIFSGLLEVNVAIGLLRRMIS